MGGSHHDMDLKASDPKTLMENQAYEMVKTMEKLLADGDAATAWHLQGAFVRVHNAQTPYSPERKAMADVWEKMMDRWH